MLWHGRMDASPPCGNKICQLCLVPTPPWSTPIGYPGWTARAGGLIILSAACLSVEHQVGGPLALALLEHAYPYMCKQGEANTLRVAECSIYGVGQMSQLGTRHRASLVPPARPCVASLALSTTGIDPACRGP